MDLLNGNESYLVEKLSKAMMEYSASLDYEKAAAIKHQIEFCRNFCKRQRFLQRFKTSNLIVYENSNMKESYTFSNGVLVSAQAAGKTIKHHWDEVDVSPVGDERYTLDLANIIYNWINRANRLSFYWA
jgi:excinuclease UvrABC nuclease subunit